VCRDLACVVWTGPGVRMPHELLRVLTDRGLAPVQADSGFAALAELCVAERAGDADRTGPRSLLVLAGVEDPERVLAAIERFAPSARVWVYEPGASPPLRAHAVPGVPARPKNPGLTRADVDAAMRKPRAGAKLVRDVESDAAHRPSAVAELKLAPAPDPGPTTGHGRRDTVEEPKPNGTPPQPVSARDVLDDAELEMLLSGERPGEDQRR